jgi:hypothetical protein
MLTKHDEFLCHQTVDTFDSVATSAREWTERIWFSAHDTEGKYQLIGGFGLYPNRNIMDAFVCFVVDRKTQYCVRASRELRPDIDEMRVGPLSYEILEPMRRVRFSLGENEYGLSCQIEFNGTLLPHEENAQFSRFRGRVLENVKRYVQVGRPSGWIKVEGKTFRVDDAGWRAERDHSWGIRRGGGVPETGVQPGEIPQGYLYNFLLAQFGDWGVTYHTRESWDAETLAFSGSVMYPSGSNKQEREILRVDHNYTFRPDIRQINGGNVVLHPNEGPPIELSIKPLSTCHIRAGGYFGFRGFTHGLWMGQSYCDGFKLDLADAQTFKEVSFLEDFMCEMRCGNEIGYGIVELVLIGKYPKYGYQSY